MNSPLHCADDDFSDGWSGPRSSVILLHGFCRNGALWRGWVPHLARQYRVIRPDLPGCGGSSDPGSGFEYTLEALFASLVGLLDALEISSAHFAGEGLGAVLSALLAAQDPRRVRSLTLLSLPGRVGPSVQDTYRLNYGSWEEALAAVGVETWWRRARAAMGDLTGDAAFDDWLAGSVGRTPVHVAVGLSRCGTSYDLTELLPHVTAPTLLIAPQSAPFTSSDEQSRLASLSPNAQLHVDPQIRHGFFMYTDPDRYAPMVGEFIDSVEG